MRKRKRELGRSKTTKAEKGVNPAAEATRRLVMSDRRYVEVVGVQEKDGKGEWQPAAWLFQHVLVLDSREWKWHFGLLGEHKVWKDKVQAAAKAGTLDLGAVGRKMLRAIESELGVRLGV